MAADFDFGGHELAHLSSTAVQDGDYGVDGQHRLALLKRLGFTHARCTQTRPVRLTKQEAKRYYWGNNMRANSPAQKFKARYFERNPVEVKIVEVCGNYGYVVTGTTGTKGRPRAGITAGIIAVAALMKCWKYGGADLLDRVLYVLSNGLVDTDSNGDETPHPLATKDTDAFNGTAEKIRRKFLPANGQGKLLVQTLLWA